jgi:hypothetical protein
MGDLTRRQREQSVRLFAIILALVFAGSVRADDWKEYENPEYSFAIHFPIDPMVEATTYRAADGRSFDGRVFSVAKDTGTFKVTVVDMPDDKTGEELARDAKPVGEGGAIKFDIGHRVRAVYGRQLGVSDANGGYAYVALFYHKKRLYQIEGKAFTAGGQAEVDAMRFQQSLDFA